MSKVSSLIEALIADARQSEGAFGGAAQAVASDELRIQFTRLTQTRARFVDELEANADTLGVTPPPADVVIPEPDLSASSDEDLVAQCRARVATTRALYESALSSADLSPTLRLILRRQMEELGAAL